MDFVQGWAAGLGILGLISIGIRIADNESPVLSILAMISWTPVIGRVLKWW